MSYVSVTLIKGNNVAEEQGYCRRLTSNVQEQKIVSTENTQNLFLIIRGVDTVEPG